MNVIEKIRSHIPKHCHVRRDRSTFKRWLNLDSCKCRGNSNMKYQIQMFMAIILSRKSLNKNENLLFVATVNSHFGLYFDNQMILLWPNNLTSYFRLLCSFFLSIWIQRVDKWKRNPHNRVTVDVDAILAWNERLQSVNLVKFPNKIESAYGHSPTKCIHKPRYSNIYKSVVYISNDPD